MKREYDNIIVGAGSSGCALARRLVDQGRSVLLVEAGRNDLMREQIGAPGRLFELWNSDVDYGYRTEPRLEIDMPSVYWPRGKTTGGSSSLNAMIYARGVAADYDNWAYEYAPGWSYDEVLPYFLKMEDHEDGSSKFHGAGGPLRITRNHHPNPVSQAFVAACQEYGLTYNEDSNVGDPLGVEYTQHTIRDGKRDSAWNAYVGPILDNPLLSVLLDTSVHRLVFSQKTCRGIEVSLGGQSTVVYASDQVILCAGTIGSAQLLLLNGLGPADDLRPLGIDVRVDLPGVGANLHDHPMVPIVYESRREIDPPLAQILEAHFFAKSRPERYGPDLQPLMMHYPLPLSGVEPVTHGYTIMAGLIRPISRGRLSLRSADPFDAPVLDPRYFDEPHDLDAMLTAVRMCRDIGEMPSMTPWRLREIAPNANSEGDLIRHIHHNVISYHHQVGTCRMGQDGSAVVDEKLAVRGVSGLRIADASVMPAVTSGNTNAPSIMIGERAADFVLAEG